MMDVDTGRSKLRLDLYIALVLVLTAVYVGACLTPSSYGLAFNSFGAGKAGLVAGTPKPLRSDEWAVWTPFVQAAVNNHFQRWNETSVYGEDLRNFNGLPLADWAIAFKPQFWAFFVADPAYAFSFSHGLLFALFLIGWYRLLLAFDFKRPLAIGGSLLLFFSAYTQLWWTTTGPLLALFPFLLLVFMAAWPPWLKGLGLFYVAMAWFLGHLYPPVVVSLAFSGAIALVALRPEVLTLRNLLVGVVAAAAAGLLTWLYLAEPFAAMSKTVYPGQRMESGGSLSPWQWLAQFFPFLVFNQGDTLIGGNYLEVATSGSWLTVLTLIFTDHRALFARLTARGEGAFRWRLLVLLAGLTLITLWMLTHWLAVPGRLLLWHLVPPVRMVFASGVLLLLLALVVLSAAPVRINRPRAAVAILVCVAAWVGSKKGLALASLHANLIDVAIVPLLVLLVAWPRLAARWPVLARPAGAASLVACCAAVNALAFGGYNPLQSAKPMFHRPQTEVTAHLDRLVAAHPQGWLVTPGFPGAILNGWGYKSLAHLQIAPHLAFFRRFFPDLPEAEFNAIFNRYAHLQLQPVERPDSPQPDVVRLPLSRF
jgi:hypothetical protein